MKTMIEFFYYNPPALVLLILIASMLMPLLARFLGDVAGYLAVLVTGFSFVLSMVFAAMLPEGEKVKYVYMDFYPSIGIEVAFDSISLYMMAVMGGISLLILLYSIPSLKKEIRPRSIGWYYTIYLMMLASMYGMVMTNDFFNLYVFVEVVGISACALVIIKNDRASTEATLKYLLLTAIGSGFMLFGIGLVYAITGHLNMDFVTLAMAGVDHYPYVNWTILSFFFVGFALKAALMPFHVWLPDAHSKAPTPSSAALSGLVVKAYIIGLVKVYNTIVEVPLVDFTHIKITILILAAIAMIAGSLFAFVQQDLKRRLAYSSVAQIGYIFLGLGLGTASAVSASFLHILHHGSVKACLFLAAGAIYYQSGQIDVRKFTGLGYKMPITFGAFTIGALSMIGLPLFSGFITKWYLAVGSIEADNYFFVILIVLSGLLNALYFFPIIWAGFFQTTGEEESIEPKFSMDKVPVLMLISISILAIFTIYLGVFPDYPLEIIHDTLNHMDGFMI